MTWHGRLTLTLTLSLTRTPAPTPAPTPTPTLALALTLTLTLTLAWQQLLVPNSTGPCPPGRRPYHTILTAQRSLYQVGSK